MAVSSAQSPSRRPGCDPINRDFQLAIALIMLRLVSCVRTRGLSTSVASIISVFPCLFQLVGSIDHARDLVACHPCARFPPSIFQSIATTAQDPPVWYATSIKQAKVW